MDSPSEHEHEQDILVSRLIARIAELEEKLYQKEFEESSRGALTSASPPPAQPPAQLIPEQPKLGFLSAIRESLKQLEESTGYVAPSAPSQPAAAPQPQHRIVYYEAPPQEVAEQLNQHQHASPLQAPLPSQTSSGSTVEWLSRLTFGAKPAPLKPEQQPSVLVSHPSNDGAHVTHTSNSQAGDGVTPRDTLDSHPGRTTGDVSSSTSQAGDSTMPASPYGGPYIRDQASNWFSSFFKKDRAAQAAGQDPLKRAADAITTDGHLRGMLSTHQHPEDTYYRYVFDPADVAAEMEVTARVRKAAAEALMQAEEKLRAAEGAQAAMQQQLEQAKELSKEIELLRQENEAALRTRHALEDEMIGTRSQLDGMRQAQSSLQEELDGMRTQAGIWKNATNDEQEKVKQENQLIRKQLQTRLTELQNVKAKLTEAEADRQRSARTLEDLNNKLQWLTKINSQLEASAQQVELLRKQVAEVQEKFMRERAVRRRLHEQLQQLRGNIRVMCRVRPAQPHQHPIITYPLEGLLAISPPDKRQQEFEFDHVFGPETTQEAIYSEVSSLVRSCADGYNVCIFAYGQTGSGKTFTMEGPESDPGINVRALKELFSIGAEEGVELNWKVQVSMLEIYNDSVYDLLGAGSEAAAVGRQSLDVSGLGAGELPPGAERVPGATWRVVNTLDEVTQVLRDGSKNRATATTALNAHSSRSHAVLSVRVTAHAQNMQLRSTIHLVDLAGSERIDKSEVVGAQLKEAQSINKSLSALGDVISALQRRTPHIPFRNAKLTQVLQDSLSGSSKVLLVCNLSPEANSASETLSSLNFASRAAQVELGSARKQQPSTSSGTSAAGDKDKSGAGLAAPSPDRAPRSTGATSSAASAGAALRPVRSSQNVASIKHTGGPPPLSPAQPPSSAPASGNIRREGGSSSGAGSGSATPGQALSREGSEAKLPHVP